MIKSLIQMNNPLKYKEEEWLNYLYNTKEKKYNVLNVYSLKEINNHSVFNYVKRSLEILDNINNKNKLDKQTLYLVEETLKWQDVSKTGNKKIRKIWKEKGYNLYCHNIGSSQIYLVHNNNEIVKVLIKTHGLIGQYIKGEINLDKNIELYNLIRDNKISSSKLKEVLLILNECIISAISKTLYDSVSNEIEVVINKIINNTFEENINYLDKLNRLNNGINKIDIDYLKSLPSNIGEILNNLFKKLEIWYYEGALNDFSIEEQVKILLLINNNINKKISNLSFESLMNILYLDYKYKK